MKVLLFLFCLSFTFILRAHNYEKTPVSEHLDEMLYAWSGIYLIETGTPVSWSTLDYPKSAEVFKGRISFMGGRPETSVTLYKPWLDQPPLFALIVGSFAHLYNADRTQFIPSSYIRIPTVIFGALTSIFVFLVAMRLGGFYLGILAMLVYGTVPIFVIGSRTALPENLIALLFMVEIYLLLLFEKAKKSVFLAPIPVLVGVAGLSKPTGFFLILFAIFAVFLILGKVSQHKRAFIVSILMLLAVLPFLVIFFWYGLHFDPQIFWRISSIQSNRPVGFASLAWFFISPAYRTQILIDGWYVFCLLMAVFVLLAQKQDKLKFLSYGFIFWVFVVMFTGGQGDLLPWYRFPVFPIMAILGAWGIVHLLKTANLLNTFLITGLLLSGKALVTNAFRPNLEPSIFRAYLLILLAPSALNEIFQKEWIKYISRVILIIVIIAGFYFNIIYVYNTYELDCENQTCPFVPTTFLSEVHFPIIWRFFDLNALD